MEKVREYSVDIYESVIVDESSEYTVYVKVMDKKSSKTVYAYIQTEERDDILYWAATNHISPDHDCYNDEIKLAEEILDELKSNLKEALDQTEKAYWNQDIDNLVHRSVIGL